jgi:hypothetical protein
VRPAAAAPVVASQCSDNKKSDDDGKPEHKGCEGARSNSTMNFGGVEIQGFNSDLINAESQMSG